MLDIKNLLKDNNLSITDTRIRIIECLSDDFHFHSVKDIEDHLKSMNTKTIYNTLDALVKANIVDVIVVNKQNKYSLNDSIIFNKEMIHVQKNDEIIHVELSRDVKNKIIKNITKEGYDVKKIRIFVETK